MIAKYYRTNISFESCFRLPFGFLHYLYYQAVQESRDANNQARAVEELEDTMNGDA